MGGPTVPSRTAPGGLIVEGPVSSLMPQTSISSSPTEAKKWSTSIGMGAVLVTGLMHSSSPILPWIALWVAAAFRASSGIAATPACRAAANFSQTLGTPTKS